MTMISPFALARMRWGTLLCLLGLSGCTSIPYSRLEAGSFTGSLIVIWVGEGGGSGDGRFLFVPDPRNPLVFKRPGKTGRGGVIKPRIMYTDGGSIPKIAQAFNGFSPWGYAPAYMIHDWLFVARHCIVDGTADARQLELADVTFDDSIEILGEAIQTLVASRQVAANDVAASTITSAVGTPIARSLWDRAGACAESQISKEHLAIAEATIPGTAAVAGRVPARARDAEAQRLTSRIVTRVNF